MGDLMERGGGGFLIFFRWKGGRGGLSEGGGLIWEGGLNRGFTVLLKIFCLLSVYNANPDSLSSRKVFF